MDGVTEKGVVILNDSEESYDLMLTQQARSFTIVQDDSN